MIDMLFYGVPIIVIAITLWIGWLGLRFYIAEVVRNKDL